MITPENLLGFTKDLSALLEKYVVGDTIEERIVADLAIDRICVDCANGGAAACSSYMSGYGMDERKIVATCQALMTAYEPLRAKFFAEQRDQRARDLGEHGLPRSN